VQRVGGTSLDYGTGSPVISKAENTATVKLVKGPSASPSLYLNFLSCTHGNLTTSVATVTSD